MILFTKSQNAIVCILGLAIASNSITIPLENIIMPSGGRYGEGGCGPFDDTINGGNNFQGGGGNNNEQGIMNALCRMLVSGPGMNNLNGCSKLSSSQPSYSRYDPMQMAGPSAPMQYIQQPAQPVQQMQQPVQQQMQQPQKQIYQPENTAQKVVYVPVIQHVTVTKTVNAPQMTNMTPQMTNMTPQMTNMTPQTSQKNQGVSNFINNTGHQQPQCHPVMENSQPKPTAPQPNGQCNTNFQPGTSFNQASSASNQSGCTSNQPVSAFNPQPSSAFNQSSNTFNQTGSAFNQSSFNQSSNSQSGSDRKSDSEQRIKIECDCRILDNGLDDCRCDKK